MISTIISTDTQTPPMHTEQLIMHYGNQMILTHRGVRIQWCHANGSPSLHCIVMNNIICYGNWCML